MTKKLILYHDRRQKSGSRVVSAFQTDQEVAKHNILNPKRNYESYSATEIKMDNIRMIKSLVEK